MCSRVATSTGMQDIDYLRPFAAAATQSTAYACALAAHDDLQQVFQDIGKQVRCSVSGHMRVPATVMRCIYRLCTHTPLTHTAIISSALLWA